MANLTPAPGGVGIHRSSQVTTAAESINARTPMGSDLAEGLQTLSLDQVVCFSRYVRLVLPLDGYVFWIRDAIIDMSARYNKGRFNAFRFNQFGSIDVPAPTLTVQGSVHYATDVRQEETEVYAANRVVFTAENEVNSLNRIAPGTLWIGTFLDGDTSLRIAFSSQSSRYYQAGLWHYVGFAVYPDMQTQIIDTVTGFDTQSVVVSNSLPAWMGLNAYAPFYGFGIPAGLTLFPSFLSPLNEAPPFGVVHINPDATKGLASAPTIDSRTSTHQQLSTDTVRVTLWGTRNNTAMDFIDAVYQYSQDTDAFGIMNIPVPRDEKRTQSELGTIAMKKSIDFEVSYIQNRINNVAGQIIKSAKVRFISGPQPPILVSETGMPLFSESGFQLVG